jgi:putative flippase GtrA
MTPRTSTAFVRYVVVGIVNNGLGYLLYLLVTAWGIGPKTTMTCLYMLAALLGYAGNRQWAFTYRGSIQASFIRYVLAHLAGYALNFGLLVIFVDRLGFPHQIVQALAIGVVALFLFVTFRLFVFAVPAPAQERP